MQHFCSWNSLHQLEGRAVMMKFSTDSPPVVVTFHTACAFQGTGVVPLSKYAVKSEINAVAWGQRWKRHVALAFGRDAQVLHI